MPTKIEALNAPRREERLNALRALAPELTVDRESAYVNNHIHTIYSFSPYSPCMALYRAQQAGLSTAGIMDHDSVSGALEFIEGGIIIGMATTVGLECRVSMADTPFAEKRVNNTDQIGNCYATMHGIPHQSLDQVEAFLKPIRAARGRRNAAMTERLNGILAPAGITLDYAKDVESVSRCGEGGSVTERHICWAAAHALINKYGKGEALVNVLTDKLNMPLKDSVKVLLLDENNDAYAYDLLGAMKSDLVQSFFIPATDESVPIADYIKAAHDAGAIAAYPYLGDVGDSVTGDKKTQAYEDSFLDELFDFLVEIGFDAVTYMPTRNTMAQIARVQALCKKHGLFEISGEDINSPRQSFICKQLTMPEFAHLRTATWALIGHEKAATRNIADGMFTGEIKAKYPDLAKRIEVYAKIGREQQG